MCRQILTASSTFQNTETCPQGHPPGAIFSVSSRWRISCKHQSFSVNVSARNLAQRFFGRPAHFAHRLTGSHYRHFFLHDLPELQEDLPLAVIARMWYMRRGAAASFGRAVRDVLNSTDHEWRITRGGPTVWAPRLPDLNPLDSVEAWDMPCIFSRRQKWRGTSPSHRVVYACQTICKCLRTNAAVRDVSKPAPNRTEDILSTYYERVLSVVIRLTIHVDMDRFSCFATCNSCPNCTCNFHFHRVERTWIELRESDSVKHNCYPSICLQRLRTPCHSCYDSQRR
jgi:hypothetical protein